MEQWSHWQPPLEIQPGDSWPGPVAFLTSRGYKWVKTVESSTIANINLSPTESFEQYHNL